MTEPEFYLTDVSALSIAEIHAFIEANPDSALADSLRRILERLDDPDGVISAFQSFAA